MALKELRFNSICLVSLVLGFICLLDSWADYIPSPPVDGINFALLPDQGTPLIFLIGTLLCLYTPVGGFLQLLSATDFIYHWQLYNSSIFQITILPFIGILSAIISLSSIRWPIWISRENGRFFFTKGIGFSVTDALHTFLRIKEKVPYEKHPPRNPILENKDSTSNENLQAKMMPARTFRIIVASLLSFAFLLFWAWLSDSLTFGLIVFTPIAWFLTPALIWISVIVAFRYSENVFARRITIVLALIMTFFVCFWAWVMLTIQVVY